ncbi:hypothetical protein RRG08_002430 [Elysia crispata]|uniref:Uncharacterized protein n=1 Tax=Elysia crispata TaxID=231223 RepID=A0AAE1A7K5_9GAST|nr:hypothetical protein RRG08_002430 [Elysia crispata]
MHFRKSKCLSFPVKVSSTSANQFIHKVIEIYHSQTQTERGVHISQMISFLSPTTSSDRASLKILRIAAATMQRNKNFRSGILFLVPFQTLVSSAAAFWSDAFLELSRLLTCSYGTFRCVGASLASSLGGLALGSLHPPGLGTARYLPLYFRAFN